MRRTRQPQGRLAHRLCVAQARVRTESETVCFRLAKAICSQVRVKLREATETVIERILTAGLQESHGTLVAVSRGDTMPKFIKDGRFFAEPVNFEQLVERAASGSEAERLRLLSYASVLEGMFGCDGIIIFNRRATVIGYNCFV